MKKSTNLILLLVAAGTFLLSCTKHYSKDDVTKSVDSTTSTTPPPITTTPPPPPIVTLPPANAYQQTARCKLALNAYKINLSGFTVGNTVSRIPDQKGKNDLIYMGAAKPILSGTLPIYTKEGLLFLQNETNVNYQAQISTKPPYPQELWYVVVKPNYFMYESFQNTYNVQYLGELGSPTNGLRVRSAGDNSSDNAWNFTNAVIPTQQFFVIRLRLTAIANNKSKTNTELWVNGVKVTSSVQITSNFNTANILDIGSTSNNEYVGWAEYMNMPVLTDAQAAQVQAEIAAEYKIGETIQLPFADNIQLASNGGKTTVSYTFNNPLGFPEDVSKRKIRWIQWGNLGVSNATYTPAYDGMTTIPIALNGRVEITVYDTNGNFFTIPMSKALEQ